MRLSSTRYGYYVSSSISVTDKEEFYDGSSLCSLSHTLSNGTIALTSSGRYAGTNTVFDVVLIGK